MAVIAFGQSPEYLDAIKQGDEAFIRGDYKTAIDIYWAAEAIDPTQQAEVREKVNTVFKQIETLRGLATENERKALAALAEADAARAQLSEALQKAQKLIDAFYFYDNKFALASFKDRQFYYIDKDGNYVEKLGRWDEATQFNSLGLAKVREHELTWLLDTLGNSYLLASSIGKLNEYTEALDLTSQLQTETIPKEVFNHNNLKILLLSDNSLTALSKSIGLLTKLRILELGGNRLSNLPPEIENLPNLTSLNLERNQLTMLPSEIGNLTNLTRLSLHQNQLTELPPEIGNVTNLTSLNLSWNRLTRLPPEIGNLSNLSNLDLVNNQLTMLMPEIGNLTNLTNLDLTSNQLTTLPPEIGNLTNLISLNLVNNQLTMLMPEIGYLTNLTNLDLTSNQLTTLPPEIGNLTNLLSLNLVNNQFTELPPEIVKLTKLTVLFMGSNQLKRLPLEIGNLTNLIGLSLGSNQLVSLPPEIGNLTNLTTLDLRNNQLTMLPPEIGYLKYLIFLHLENNQLSELPREIGNLIELTEFNLEGNNLSDLNPDIINGITNSLVLRVIANVFAKRMDCSSALMYFLKAIDNNPDPSDYGNAGICYAVLGEFDLAIEFMLIRLNLSPDDALALVVTAFTYYQQKDYANAYAYQKKLVEVESNESILWFSLSWYSLFTEKYDEAIFAAQKSLEINPDAKSVERNLALGYLLNNEWEKAEGIFLRWRGKTFPDDQGGRLCDDLFLMDIEDLEKAGIHHPDFKKVKEMFRKE